MTDPPNLSTAVRKDMESRDINVELSLDILARYNRGEFDHVQPIRVTGIPAVDGRTVLDFTGDPAITVPADTARERLDDLLPGPLVDLVGVTLGTTQSGQITFTRCDLETIGLLLMPRVAYGVLNGGSATSYADGRKNRAFSEALVALLAEPFDALAALSHGRAKGLTPAFIQPDGSPGPSFLQLKMRGLLALAIRSRATIRRMCPDCAAYGPEPLLPLFQMTSIHTEGELREEYSAYRHDPLLSDLIATTGVDPTTPVGAVQPMISAYSHSRHGRPKTVFTGANGNANETLALPGGHGQNFAVMEPVYTSLRNMGKRFIYLGNVDNLGYLPDPVEVACLAVTGNQAGFDFAFRTAVDVKGGILVRDQHDHFSCADIGPAITREDVHAAEASGSHILFNAATGLFDLDFLVPNLDRIARDLPTRFTDQSKDAGDYSQAEQVTWEVIGMLDNILIFSVEKRDRFLAAKLLCETLMTSGLRLNDPSYPTDADPAHDLRSTAENLHHGLIRKLETSYAMELRNGTWQPKDAAQLITGGEE